VERTQRIVEPRIPDAVELQSVGVRTEPVQMLVDTAEVVVDIVLAVGNIEVDMVLVLKLVQDTGWVLDQQWDTGLILAVQLQVMQRVAASRTDVRHLEPVQWLMDAAEVMAL